MAWIARSEPVCTIARPTFANRFGASLRHEELAPQDRVEEPVVLASIQVEKRIGAEHAGIVEQDVDPAEVSLGGANDRDGQRLGPQFRQTHQVFVLIYAVWKLALPRPVYLVNASRSACNSTT